MTVTRKFAGYEFDDDASRVDREVVWSFLSEHAYWGRWRSREIVDAQIDGAWRVVGAYEPAGDGAEAGEMVGFARALSDGVSIAYLADVFVDFAHRGRGVGASLVAAMIEDGAGADLRWMLHTADGHDLYAKFGFTAPEHNRYMERAERRPEPTSRLSD
ncbi:GNAT family N-acetyltransferase [Phytoactinopolyspora mesophila]|uniref:GNAT family N-acetyltransferase n=1 Tax=Phytoactinopolyspora mesophila TaxID=2650750 RepID=A0A7K3MAH1_9ACTN|nr:GNAT family N-acetyltransferase [Phytoactinopolyspora mesophila]